LFQLNSITLKNFRSFSGEHFFEFPTEPGLYCITGLNKKNPGLGRNGVGKSSLLEAAYWAIYGKTSRNLKGNDVVTWGAKGCSVVVSLTVGNTTHIIERQQNPNNLVLNGAVVDQNAINKAVRLGSEAFLYAVMLPQFGDSFFDLSPANKLSLFSEIMELDFWLDKSRQAAEEAKELDDKKAVKERLLAKCQGRLESLKAEGKRLLDEAEAFNEKQKDEFEELKAKADALKVSLTKEEKLLKTAKQAYLGAEQRLAALPKPDKAVASHKITTLRVAIAKLNDVGAQCPTCFQSVPQSHLKAEQARLKGELAEAEAEAKKAAVIEKDQKAITQNRDDFAREVRLLENRILGFKKDMEYLTSQTKELEKKTNPYLGMIENCQRDCQNTEADIAEIKLEVEELEKKRVAISYWISGFKRIRLFIIEETLLQLELEVNNNLAGLGLSGWRVEFDVERENKSGGVTKGFTVLVYTPEHKSPVKYEAWCGGETQRLRLAGDLGLANLIMQGAGLNSRFEAFDEPSAHMSQEGILDLTELLAERAATSQKTIFLVDHHSIEFGGFAGTITMVRDHNGSSIRK